MKIVQSFWTCGKENALTNSFGWLAPEYNLMSWALSCLQLKQYYNQVVLYSDSYAAKVLIDEIGLPYTENNCVLDKLNHYHPQLWALPKILTYSLQEEPFLHVDGDVYVWKKFQEELLQSPLIAQNLEIATSYYGEIMKTLESSLTYFPAEILEDRIAKHPIHAYNAGIFGGTDTAFIKAYAKNAFEFVDNNSACFSKIVVNNFNVFFEQYLFLCMVKNQHKKVSLLIDTAIGDNRYIGFGNFCDVPFKKQYLHLLGGYKKNEATCVQLAARLREDYPEYYYRIVTLFRRGSHPLRRNYYYNNQNSEQVLLQRRNVLKTNFLSGKTKQYQARPKNTFLQHNTEALVGEDLKNKLPKEKLEDLVEVCKKIDHILTHKFSNLSEDYLYGRDLSITAYFPYIFENTAELPEKILVSDNLIEFINCQYNWSIIFYGQTLIPKNKIEEMYENKLEETHLAVVPECDQQQFSMVRIDEIDNLILTILSNGRSVRELMKELRKCLGKEIWHSSKNEFEQIVLGKLKLGLLNKTIRVKMENSMAVLSNDTSISSVSSYIDV